MRSGAVSDELKPYQDTQISGASGIGCAATLVCVNVFFMGLLASTFTRGPYSSAAQELWYRYGSAAFLIGGALLPAGALLLRRRYPCLVRATTIWMLAALLAFFGYAFMSGGGV